MTENLQRMLPERGGAERIAYRKKEPPPCNAPAQNTGVEYRRNLGGVNYG